MPVKIMFITDRARLYQVLTMFQGCWIGENRAEKGDPVTMVVDALFDGHFDV